MKYAPIVIDYGDGQEADAFQPQSDCGAALLRAGIWALGVNRLTDRFRGGSTCSWTHLLYAVIDGAVECLFGTETRKVEAGNMYIAPARGPHRVELASGHCTAVWVHLYQQPQWFFLLESGVHMRPMLVPDELGMVTELLLRAARPETPSGQQMLELYEPILLACLQRELRDLHHPHERLQQQRLQEVWQEVRGNPSHAWSKTNLARRAGLAPGYLPEVCRRLFGVTPMRKVTMIRMDLAQQLLITSDLSLADIAGRVGYSSEYAFSDAFKRIHGQRPGAMRRQSAPWRGAEARTSWS